MIINLALLFVIGVGLWFGVIVNYISSVSNVSLAHKEEIAVKSVINYYEDLIQLKKGSCQEKKKCEAILQTKPSSTEYSCDDLRQCNDYAVLVQPTELAGIVKRISGSNSLSTSPNSIYIGKHSKFVLDDNEEYLYGGFYYSTKSYTQCVAALNNMINFTNIRVSQALVTEHITTESKNSVSYGQYPTAAHSAPEGVCLGVSPHYGDARYIWIRVIEE